MGAYSTLITTLVAPLRHIQPSTEVPPGWEVRRTQSGRIQYFDHNTRSTTWIRPSYSLPHIPPHTPQVAPSQKVSQQALASYRHRPCPRVFIPTLPHSLCPPQCRAPQARK
ncbi:hypothetical protein BGW80DRAFT_725503 [Lactifluus volemus]|nr:hypothetical protein BGW80DRAFT_725503 [Lactifluus volemus]